MVGLVDLLTVEGARQRDVQDNKHMVVDAL